MKHRPRKRFGQNFLTDNQVIDGIINLIRPRQSDLIVEVGPGRGALTGMLLESGCELHVVELDRDLAAKLVRQYDDADNFHLHSGDVLAMDLAELTGGRQFRLIGNLPYNISSPMLFHAFQWPRQILDMVFMLQKEVVNRMAATPGSSDYGRLSVMCQFYCQVIPEFIVPPEAFYPPPKVESRLVRLIPHARPPVKVGDDSQFAGLVRLAFSQRRKTLRNALKIILDQEAIQACGVDPGARAETLDLAAFARLANAAAKSG